MAGDAINAMLCGAGHNLRKILARLRALLYLLAGEAREALQALCRHLEVYCSIRRLLWPSERSEGFHRID